MITLSHMAVICHKAQLVGSNFKITPFSCVFCSLGARKTKDQLQLFKNFKLYKNKGTILQAIVESRCPKTLKKVLEIDKGKSYISECLKEELNQERNKTFIHDVCETPLVDLVKMAITDTEQVLKRLGKDGVTPLMK